MAQPRRLDTTGMALEMLANSTPSGGKSLLGSMNMDAFLQDVWDKDPSLQETIGSLTASFQMPDPGTQAGVNGGEASVCRTSNRAMMELLIRNQQHQQQQAQKLQLTAPSPAAAAPEGHRVIASTGFAIPADFSGRTVDEVWSQIADVEVPYDNMRLGQFLEKIGVRSIEDAAPPPSQGFGPPSRAGVPHSQPPQHLPPPAPHHQGQQLPYAGHVISPHAGAEARLGDGGAGALYGAPQPHLDRQLEAELQRQQQEQAVLQQHLVHIQQGAGGISAPAAACVPPPLSFSVPTEEPQQQQQYEMDFGAPAYSRSNTSLYGGGMQTPQFQASALSQAMGPPPPRAGPPPLQGIPIAQPIDEGGGLGDGSGSSAQGLQYGDRGGYGGSGGGADMRVDAQQQGSGSLDRSPAPEGSPAPDGQVMPEIPAARGGAAKPAPPSAAAAAAARAARQRKRKEAPGSPEPENSKAELRMVKNRESAARSRLRKQAYTSELEAQVEALRKQNAELRERVIRACPALDAAALRRAPAGDKPLRRTRTDPT